MAVLGSVTWACMPSEERSQPPQPGPATASAAARVPTACAVTLAFQQPPDQVRESARAGANVGTDAGQAANWAGSSGIWVPLPDDGRVTWGSASRASKFPIWVTVSGAVTATARRLDGASPTVRAEFNGGHPTGQGPGFNATGIAFPSDGCWEVAYQAREGSLTFVVSVIRD